MHNRLLHKAARVLEAIAEHRALGLEELHLLLCLPKPTLKRLLDDFEELGWLYRRLGDKRYVVLAGIGGPGDARYRLAKASSPFLNELFESTGLASDLVITTPLGPCILESNYSRLGIRIGQDRIIGACPCPLRAASGRALTALAWKETSWPWGGTEPDDHHLRMLDEERRHGYFRRLPGSWEYTFRRPFDIDAIAIALPFGDRVMAALNLYWDTRRLSPESVEATHLPRLETIGRRLAATLEAHVTTLDALSTGDVSGARGVPH